MRLPAAIGLLQQPSNRHPEVACCNYHLRVVYIVQDVAEYQYGIAEYDTYLAYRNYPFLLRVLCAPSVISLCDSVR